jgi:hypothetical protein
MFSFLDFLKNILQYLIAEHLVSRVVCGTSGVVYDVTLPVYSVPLDCLQGPEYHSSGKILELDHVSLNLASCSISHNKSRPLNLLLSLIRIHAGRNQANTSYNSMPWIEIGIAREEYKESIIATRAHGQPEPSPEEAQPAAAPSTPVPGKSPLQGL